jgi:hypothetical protein
MAVALWLRDDVHGETGGLARALYIRFEKDLDITMSYSLITPAFAARDLLHKSRPCFEHSALQLSRCSRFHSLRSQTILRAAGIRRHGQHTLLIATRVVQSLLIPPKRTVAATP